MTEGTTEKLIFEAVGRSRVEADFSAGQVSSDGGVLLVREANRRIGLSERMAECFVDYRDSKQVEHSVKELIRQRVMVTTAICRCTYFVGIIRYR